MEGITVLATNVVQNGSVIAGIFCFVSALALVCAAAYAICEDSFGVGCLAVVVAIVLTLIGISFITDKSVTVRYDVTISDSVSLKEFNKKYNILSQNGEIYTVVEKDEE